MDEPSRRGSHRRLRAVGLAAIVPAVLVAAWFAVTSTGQVKPLFVPAPEVVWDAFRSAVDDYRGHSLGEHLGFSLLRVIGSCAIAIAVAVPLGLLVGRNRTARLIINPSVNFYRVLPPLAYYSLLVLWMGIGESGKWTLLALAAFPPVFIAVQSGAASIPADRLAAAQMLGARGWRLYRSVVIPSVLPDMFTGIRVAIGFSYTTLVAAEMVAGERGIGAMVWQASGYLRTDVIWMGIIIMGITGVILDWVVGRISRRVVRWPSR